MYWPSDRGEASVVSPFSVQDFRGMTRYSPPSATALQRISCLIWPLDKKSDSPLKELSALFRPKQTSLIADSVGVQLHSAAHLQRDSLAGRWVCGPKRPPHTYACVSSWPTKGLDSSYYRFIARGRQVLWNVEYFLASALYIQEANFYSLTDGSFPQKVDVRASNWQLPSLILLLPVPWCHASKHLVHSEIGTPNVRSIL